MFSRFQELKVKSQGQTFSGFAEEGGIVGGRGGNGIYEHELKHSFRFRLRSQTRQNQANQTWFVISAIDYANQILEESVVRETVQQNDAQPAPHPSSVKKVSL